MAGGQSDEAQGVESGKGGRPSKYSDIDLDQVKKLAEKGWTDREMADFFGVHVSTWHRWKGVHAEFCDSLSVWKELADERVERALYERAIGYSHQEDKIFNNNGEELVIPTIKHYPPDSTSMIFWLKNRKPDQWRDKPEGDDGDKEQSVGKIQIEVVGANAEHNGDTASS